MVIFGYSYNKDEILQSKVPVTFLDFSEYKKIKKDDFVVVFGLSFTGSDTFSFQTMSEVCYRAENLVYISSSSVYPFSLFKHKESRPLITPRSFDGAVNLSLEEFVLDTGIDMNKNTVVLRVDLLEESGFINIIKERAVRGIYGSIFTRLSVISVAELIEVLNKIEINPENFSQKTYNVSTKSLSEFSYYKSIAVGKVYPSLAIKNTSFDVSKAKRDGLL